MEKAIKRSTGIKQELKIRTLRVFSRHPSHRPLRNRVKLPFLACLRLGSLTSGTLPYKVEINSPEAIKNSSSKLRMKTCFTEKDVKTADWFTTLNGAEFKNSDNHTFTFLKDLPYPVVTKHLFGSRGEGNTLLKNEGELKVWLKGKTLSNYIFEKFCNFNKEYRLHIDSEGCFYTCRKMLKEGTPDDERWHRHDSNSVWILENNPQFEKPSNWDEVVKHSIMALNAVGLDVGAVDLKIQSETDRDGNKRKSPDFIVIEINSAPSFGEQTLLKYIERLPIIVKRKYDRIYNK